MFPSFPETVCAFEISEEWTRKHSYYLLSLVMHDPVTAAFFDGNRGKTFQILFTDHTNEQQMKEINVYALKFPKLLTSIVT